MGDGRKDLLQEQQRGREKRKCENFGPLRRKESTEDEACSRPAGELQLTQWMEKMGNDRRMYWTKTMCWQQEEDPAWCLDDGGRKSHASHDRGNRKLVGKGWQS